MQVGSKNNKITSLTVTEYGAELRHIHGALREWLSKCAPLTALASEYEKEQLRTIINICNYEV